MFKEDETTPQENAPDYSSCFDICAEIIPTFNQYRQSRDGNDIDRITEARQELTSIKRKEKLDNIRFYTKLRAEGHSIRAAAQMTGISKTTAQVYEKEVKSRVASIQEAELLTVYEEYGLSRVARIRRIGDELQAVEGVLAYRKEYASNYLESGDQLTTIEEYNLNQYDGSKQGTKTTTKKLNTSGYWGISTEKLIELKLKLIDKLEKLYIPIREEAPREDFSPENVLFACADYLDKVRSGELQGRQATLEAQGLQMLVRALEANASIKANTLPHSLDFLPPIGDRGEEINFLE